MKAIPSLNNSTNCVYCQKHMEDLNMKLMIASDLHGSAYFGKKLLDAFRAEQPEKLLLLATCCTMAPGTPCPGNTTA